jgi:hypothetical protein
VNFRELVPELRYSAERYTHQLHPYPAKLLQHIPYFFLRTDLFPGAGATVLDPFCGSGTVPLEVAIREGSPVGADSNPLARLITRAKLTPVDEDAINEWLALLARNWDSCEEEEPDVVNLSRWFYPHVVRQLSKLSSAVACETGSPAPEFLAACFSATVGKVSLADPRVSVPVRLRPERYETDHWLRAKSSERLNRLKRINVRKKFESIVCANLARLRTLPFDSITSPQIFDDARSLKPEAGKRLGTATVDLAITSPPYLGAQKYVRASSLSLGWLGLWPSSKLRELEDKNIGREHHRKRDYLEFIPTGLPGADRQLERIAKTNPLRAHIASSYFREMRLAFAETSRVLKSGASLVLVTSNNTVCGQLFPTKKFLRYMLEEEFGLVCDLELIDHIKSRGLMTRRNKTAATITSESIYLFRKN